MAARLAAPAARILALPAVVALAAVGHLAALGVAALGADEATALRVAPPPAVAGAGRAGHTPTTAAAARASPFSTCSSRHYILNAEKKEAWPRLPPPLWPWREYSP